jgi:FMN-dependent oxidoreductase (nitrilotriacetate monooxygenase family)
MGETNATRRMHLAAFTSAGPVSGIHGGWRHPAADRNILAANYYARIARTLEEGCFDLMFLADILAVPDRLHDSMDSQLRYGALGALRLDPMIVLASVIGATRHLGLAATVSTTYYPPFHIARAFATLDHLSGGRAAWNIVTSFQQAEAKNFGLDEHLSREARYERADEFVEVCCKLWDSWGDDALVLDPAAPMFADPSKVRRVDHEGTYFKVRGPLNVSRGPQGRPVFVQAGASDRGRDFAARWAEVIFITPPSIEAAKSARADLRARAEKFGRDPDSIKVLPGVCPVVAETRAIATERRAMLGELSEADAGLSTLAYHLDVDLSTFPQDQVLPEMDVSGVQGHYKEVAEMTRKTGMPLRQLGKQYGSGRHEKGFTGTATDIVDTMAEWHDAGACDGFMFQVPYAPGGVEDIVRLIIPEMQRRGRFRTAYEADTLRGHLGLARPPA